MFFLSKLKTSSRRQRFPKTNPLLFFPQVGDQIVEINGEPTQGITHTRAIELIQAGGNKVLLLLRPGTGLIPDHGTSSQGLFAVEGPRQGSKEG